MVQKIFLAIIVFSNLALAKVNISNQYYCPLDTLKLVETNVQKAFERDEEMQKYMAYYVIDNANSITLGCGPHLPDKDGKGCLLNFSIKLGAETSINLAKKALIKGKPKEIEDGLKKVDPNTTQDHQHFGSIFEPQDTYGSHYYCQPEGTEGKKTWGCYLYVHESLN